MYVWIMNGQRNECSDMIDMLMYEWPANGMSDSKYEAIKHQSPVSFE